MTRVRARAALSCAALCACATTTPTPTAPAARAPALLDVDVGVLPDATGRAGGVTLRYCVQGTGGWPRRIAPENRRALPFLVSAVDDTGAALAVDGEGVDTRGLAGCARLVVDVGRLADAMMDKDLALRAGDDLIVTPDLWLWRPEPFDDDAARLFVKVDAAPFDTLMPWTEEDDGRFVVDRTTFALKSDAAFGRFEVEQVDAAGARFSVARLDDGRAPRALSAWLAASANAVATVTGTYPVPRMNVLIVPTQGERPIVVGFFARGGGPTATFFVGDGGADAADADIEATGRWALTHELAHALLPAVRVEDAWLNEGLATWHQDLLARRAGLLPDDEAYWREVVRGLQTGEARAREDGLSLDDASARMHETRAYQHAYWAGVAVVMLAELDARQHGASIDDMVRALRDRFPRDDRPRTARELLAAVPEGPGAVAARALMRAFDAHRRERFPDVTKALRDLGVSVDGVGGVHLDDRAPLAAVRRAITQLPPAVAASWAARPASGG